MNKWESFSNVMPVEGRFYDVYIKSYGNDSYGLRKTDILFREGEFKVCLLCKEEYISHFMNTPPRPE